MKSILSILLVFLFVSNIQSQEEEPYDIPPRGHRDKIEELEKLKLIEVLDLDEDAFVIFFARRKEQKDNMRQLWEKRDELLKTLEIKLKEDGAKESEYSSLVEQIIEIENLTFKSKIDYLNSLNDILTKEEIAKLVVFEHVFKREIRDAIMGKARGRRYKNRDR